MSHLSEVRTYHTTLPLPSLYLPFINPASSPTIFTFFCPSSFPLPSLRLPSLPSYSLHILLPFLFPLLGYPPILCLSFSLSSFLSQATLLLSTYPATSPFPSLRLPSYSLPIFLPLFFFLLGYLPLLSPSCSLPSFLSQATLLFSPHPAPSPLSSPRLPSPSLPILLPLLFPLSGYPHPIPPSPILVPILSFEVKMRVRSGWMRVQTNNRNERQLNFLFSPTEEYSPRSVL